MAKCTQCHGCLHYPQRDGDLVYLVCKLCKKVFVVENKTRLLEVTDEELKLKILKNTDMGRID